jgi:hypothetical protein
VAGPGGRGPRAAEELRERGGAGGEGAGRSRRRRTRRGGKRQRRRRRKGDGWVSVKVLHCNIRGYTSKQESLEKILQSELPEICTLNETNLCGKKT